MGHRLLFGATLALLAAACGAKDAPCPSPTCPSPTTTTTSGPPSQVPVVLVGAGDIAVCGSAGTIATAKLLDGIQGTVVTLGDNVYYHGSLREFLDCYEPTWGRHKDRTFPSPGNHDYETPGAAGYFDYFGESAGQPGLGYYSYDLGSWHILSLNSNISASAGSPQYAFVARDLTTRPASCTLAYWHHPLFSSGPNGNTRTMTDIYKLLYDNGADVVLNGHEHWYERFEPQTADGVADTARGIRQFVVGTGGGEITGEAQRKANSAIRIGDFGVLRLTLQQGSYDWNFVRVGGAIADSGAGGCH